MNFNSYQNRFDSDKNEVFNTRFESIANELVEKLNDPGGKWTFFKLAKRLPKPIIDRLVVKTLERNPDNKGAYFTTLAENEVQK